VTFKKYLTGLLFLASLALLAGLILVYFTDIKLLATDVCILTLSFLSIALLTIYLFHRGRKKEPASQTMHILAAISVKMLLELILVLLWFFVSKKTGTASLLLFFVLYLAFSVFLIYLMLNTLKTKSL
jgi:heme/copper-type cytochrome/quinol oxidase subunit 4